MDITLFHWKQRDAVDDQKPCADICRQESIPVGCQPPAWQPVCFIMNKFEHVLGGSMYGKAQCIMGNGHMGPTPLLSTDADTTENITFPQPTFSSAGGNK